MPVHRDGAWARPWLVGDLLAQPFYRSICTLWLSVGAGIRHDPPEHSDRDRCAGEPARSLWCRCIGARIVRAGQQRCLVFDDGSRRLCSCRDKRAGRFCPRFRRRDFMASDPAVYRRGLVLLMPSRAEETTVAALDDASRGLRGWMVGQAISSRVVAALTWAGLALLGVPASGGLGLIAGLLDVIPMLGPIIAGVPAVLLAFTVSPITALWTLLLFLLVQQLQGNFLQPMIQKQAVDVPPAVLLFAVVAAGMLFGSLGVLLAAPLTVVVYVIVQRVYVRTLLGKPIKIAGRD
jgi:hypothetical protein